MDLIIGLIAIVIHFSADGAFDFTGRCEKHRFHLF